MLLFELLLMMEVMMMSWRFEVWCCCGKFGGVVV